MKKVNQSSINFLTTVGLFLISAFYFQAEAVPLSGNYTINKALPTSGTNFQSFNDFAGSVYVNGISADVIVSVTQGSGPYIEQVNFLQPISGTGPTARVIIEGNGETITDTTNTTDRYIIRLYEVQY